MSNFGLLTLLDVKRIFETSPEANFLFSRQFLIFFISLFLLGIILRIILIFQKNKVKRRLLRKIKNLTLVTSILGFLYLFFRVQGVYFLSGRFWLILILLTFIIWLLVILFYAFFRFPDELKAYKKELLIKKYLPKAKKK